MELKVNERLMIMKLLPKEANFITLKLINQLMENLSFSQEEIEEYQIKQTKKDNQIFTTWNENNKKGKEIKIEHTIKKMIREKLEELDEKGKLTNEHLDLCYLFLETEN